MCITSRDNTYVKQVKQLLEDGKARRKQRLFAAEGARLCEDAALSGVPLRFALYTEQAEDSYPGTLEALRKTGAPCMCISGTLSRMLGDTVTPQGIFCVGEWLDKPDGRDKIVGNVIDGGCALALEAVRDPANMGAIIRTAEAFGADALFVSDDCCDIYSPKVLRGSMGGVFRLPVINCGDMTAQVLRWRETGLSCWACVVSGGTPLDAVRLGSGSVAVIGNEGAGLKPETANACRGRITIPMKGRAESLNASMAAGIVLWEMCKGK